MSNLLDKLRCLHSQTESVIQWMSGSALSTLSPDDEFEVDYLVDNLAKNSKKLHSIAERYGSQTSKSKSNFSVGSSDVKLVNSNFNSFADKKSEVLEKTCSSNEISKAEIVEFKNNLASLALVDSDSDETEPDEAEYQKQPEPDKDTADVVSAFLNDTDDEFGCDFDPDLLQQIEEVEKSYTEIEVPADDDNSDATDCEEDENYDPANQPQEKKYLDVLKKYFGYACFKPLQWKIISSVLNDKRDNCVIMSTGYGKSLCYQYPSVYTRRTTVVVSPLISLMEDQVLGLSAVNIKSCLLGSAQENTRDVQAGIMRGEYRVVYMTPELASGSSSLLANINKAVGIDLIAIDEAHCVSQWGNDFRTSYRSLGSIRQALPEVPIMALTATATPEVRKDICRSLKLKGPVITCTGFDRPNLFLGVGKKSGDICRDLRSEMVRIKDSFEFEGPTIIYCPTKKSAEEVENQLKMMNISCGLYHAGLALGVRKKTHHMFINDQIKVIVATVAFGMGIDKPDVRKIIHYGAPKDIESYYQEIGRAGRDGLPSSCSIFYSTADFSTNRFFLSTITSETFRNHKQTMLRKMEDYLGTTKCRRRAILSHFEDRDITDIGGTLVCCDNCVRKIQNAESGQSESADEVERDVAKEAKCLFNAIKVTGGRFGLTVPLLVLRGSSDQKVSRYHNVSAFGTGKHKSEKWWKAFARQLMSEDYLAETPVVGLFGSTVDLSPKAYDWLRSTEYGDAKLMLSPSQDLLLFERLASKPELSIVSKSTILPSVVSNIWLSSRQLAGAGGANKPPTPVDPEEEKLQKELYGQLIRIRNELSSEIGLNTYMIFSNKSLVDFAKLRPTTVENLCKIEDVAEEKAIKYGSRFLDCIKEFGKEKSWETDIVVSEPVSDELSILTSPDLKDVFDSLGDTVKCSYQLFELEKESLETIASKRGIKPGTVVSHMCTCISAGLPVDVERLGVTENDEKVITETIRKPPINSDVSKLSPIKEQLPDYTYDQIKVVIAILQRRYAMTSTDAHLPSTQTGSSSAGAKSSLQRFERTASNNNSKPTCSSFSQETTDTQKRKVPDWMSSDKPKSSVPSKKIKNSSLFNR